MAHWRYGFVFVLPALEQLSRFYEEVPCLIDLRIRVYDDCFVNVDDRTYRQIDIGNLQEAHGATSKLVTACTRAEKVHEWLEDPYLVTIRSSCVPMHKESDRPRRKWRADGIRATSLVCRIEEEPYSPRRRCLAPSTILASESARWRILGPSIP